MPGAYPCASLSARHPRVAVADISTQSAPAETSASLIGSRREQRAHCARVARALGAGGVSRRRHRILAYLNEAQIVGA